MKKAAIAAAVALGVALFFARSEAPAPSVKPVEPPPASARVEAAQPIAREERREVAVSLPALAGVAQAFAAQVGRANRAQSAIAEARAGRIDPVELGRRLREATAGHPELGNGLLHALEEEKSPEIAMQLAHALAALEDDAGLRLDTVVALRAASPATRAVGLLALLGRGDADALRLAADTLASDAPEARATAAFLLNNAPGGLPAGISAPALAAAREIVSDAGAAARLREEATTLLGREGAPEADVALLERALFTAEPAVRMRALAALERTGSDRVKADFDRVLRDPQAPPRLVEMATAWRAAHP